MLLPAELNPGGSGQSTRNLIRVSAASHGNLCGAVFSTANYTDYVPHVKYPFPLSLSFNK